LVKRGNFRNERGAQPACLFIVAALQIGHACRETIPGGLDCMDGVVIVDFPGRFAATSPQEFISLEINEPKANVEVQRILGDSDDRLLVTYDIDPWMPDGSGGKWSFSRELSNITPCIL
jgi:hypothetical protein